MDAAQFSAWRSLLQFISAAFFRVLSTVKAERLKERSVYIVVI